MTATKTILDVRPREGEVAAVHIPPGAEITWEGKPVRVPEPEFGCFAELGWNRVSEGADYVWHASPNGLRKWRAKRSRPVWEEAGRILAAAAREGTGPVVVYVAIEEQEEYGRPVLTAVRVRREGEE